jgi:hypothetical protein
MQPQNFLQFTWQTIQIRHFSFLQLTSIVVHQTPPPTLKLEMAGALWGEQLCLAKLEIKFQGTQTYLSEIRVTTLIRLLPAEAQELFAFGGVGSNCIAQTHQ